MGKIDRSELLRRVKAAFPNLIGELNQCDGLLSLEMGVLRRHVQSAIDEEDTATVETSWSLAEAFAREGNRRVVNSLAISFLGHLNFDDGRSRRHWALELMPPHLMGLRNDLIKYKAALLVGDFAQLFIRADATLRQGLTWVLFRSTMRRHLRSSR